MHKLGQGLALAAMIALVGCAAKSPVSLNASDYVTTAVSQVGAPTVASFSPASGDAGTVVTITGSGFDATVPTNNTVLFNGVPGLVSSASATTLTATVPQGAAYGTVTVIVNGKTASSVANFSTNLGIQTIAGTLTPQNVPATSIPAPYYKLARDSQGNAYATAANVVYKIAPDGTLTTVVGNGKTGYTGDGGLATQARFQSSMGVCVDASGNLLIADPGNQVIRKIDAVTHVVSTVAGIGNYGYSGDGGAATSANLSNPSCVAVDATGDLFIADAGNNRIREINASTGVITTVAGNGTGGFSGDGGAATSANLSNPLGVTVDATGDLFIADMANNRIREVNATTGVITTVAGNGYGYSGDGGAATSAYLRYPQSVTVDATGDLFIADQGNHRVREVNATTGVITTVAGNGTYGYSGDGGAATSAQISYPQDVSVDAAGNLLISADSHIRKVDATTGTISTVAGLTGSVPLASGSALTTKIAPYAMAEDAHGTLYFSSLSSAAVYKLSNGSIAPVVGTGTPGYSGDGGLATAAQLNYPAALAVDATGDLLIADTSNDRIRKVDTQGNITTVAGTGPSSGYSGDGGPATSAHLGSCQGLAVDAAGDLFIADTNSNRIHKVDTTGTITTIAGTGARGFAGDGGPASQALLNSPTTLALDALGNVYFVDSGNSRVRKIDTHGVITSVAGDGIRPDNSRYELGKAINYTFETLPALTVDPAGTVYLADRQGHRIYRVRTDGTLSTYAGNGTSGYSGDGGPADQAQFGNVSALLWSHSGHLLMADGTYGVIRSIGF